MSVREPYVLDRGTGGLCHIRLVATGQCLACVRVEAVDILTQMVRRETIAEIAMACDRRPEGHDHVSSR